MKSDSSSGAYATLSTFLVDDSFMGQTVTNALYSGTADNTTPSVFVNRDKKVGVGTVWPGVRLHVEDGTPSQSNDNLNGLFVANNGSSASFFNIQSATDNGRVFAVTNTGIGRFDGGVSGTAADYAEMFEWMRWKPG